MLLVPGQVGLTLLFQPEVEEVLLINIEALVRVHIGLPAVPVHLLHEEYNICILALHMMSPRKLIFTIINMTILPIALCQCFCIFP